MPEKNPSPFDSHSVSLPPAPLQTVIAFPHTGDYRKDALIESLNFRWNAGSPVGTPVTVTYSFAAAPPSYVRAIDIQGFEPFSAYDQNLARTILQRISSFTNIDFREVADSSASYGQIRFSKSQQTESAGFAFLPFSNRAPIDGDVFIDTGSVTSQTSYAQDYSLFAHEIFHALGLKHPGNYDVTNSQSANTAGNFLGRGEDSHAYTTLSYRSVPQHQPSFGGVYDILTLQYLYGVRPHETRNTGYQLTDGTGAFLDTIVDGGGIDDLDLSAISLGARVDLREGNFSSIGTIAPGIAAINNLAIAFGTTIENVIGTSFADNITGNESENFFLGMGGNDQFDGQGGLDTVSYQNDPAGVQVSLETGIALDGFGNTDSLLSIEFVSGSRFADILRGNGGRNTLAGLAGNDTLDGGGQAAYGIIPQFIGDAADYSNSGAVSVIVNLMLGTAQDGQGGIDTLINIEDVLGSSGSDTLIGDNGRNGFRGFAGDDSIDGMGNDPQQGDFISYFLDPAAVTVDLKTGIARDGYGGTDSLRGIENVNGSRFSDSLRGDDGRNIFQGLNGDDNISGDAGFDLSIYQGARRDYGITSNSGLRTITDSVTGRDGTDSLLGIERLLFNDGVLAFDNTAADSAGIGYLLYRAAFDREPDLTGLGYWIGELDRGQDYVSVVAASFIASPEFISKYGSNPSNEAFIDLLYRNVLDRAPDNAGYAYWLEQINGGQARSNVLTSFAISDENINAVRPLINDGIWFV